MKYGHLERFEARLYTLSPVFIGSGQRLTKREYLLDAANRKVYLLDLPGLVTILEARGRLEAFEAYLAQPGQQTNLYLFLKQHGLLAEAIEKTARYGLDAGEALKDERFRDLLLCMKDAATGQPYIPGSSIKGAIRTALAAHAILCNLRPEERMALAAADARVIESRLFRRLRFQDSDNAVNDVMRGLRVSDTAPIPFEELTLCGKLDRRVDGSLSRVPLYRECIRPGATLNFQITLEPAILKEAGWSWKSVVEALENFEDAYHTAFASRFPESEGEDAEYAAKAGAPLLLGGGAGYPTKTFAYPLYGADAVSRVAREMQRFPAAHRHDRDTTLGVSPHTLKMAQCGPLLYQYGRCELIVEGA